MFTVIVMEGLGQDLLDSIRAATGIAQLELRHPPEHLSGGYYAEMVRFRLDGAPPELDRDLVARIVPNPATGRTEAAVQAYVADHGVATPRVRLTCPETSALGRFAIVMDLVDGRPPLAGIGGTALVRQLPLLVRGLPEQLAEVAARLHQIDPAPLEQELRALDTGVPVTATEFVELQLLGATVAGAPELVDAAEELLGHEPRSPARAVTHGDLHPFNLLERPDGPVLIDWTLAAVAHPAFTLSFTCLLLEHPPVELPRAARAGLRPVGRRMSRRFVDAYRRTSEDAAEHLDPEALDWHRRLHALRICVELAGWDAGDGRPPHHPWTIMEPTARSVLGLR